MTHTPYNWVNGDQLTAARLNNIELQYDHAKADFGAITVTMVVSIENVSHHWEGADYIVPQASTSAETYINNAINAAAALGGGEVLLLEGTYTIDGEILLKDHISLAGMGAGTQIKLKDNTSVTMSMIRNNTITAPGNKNMTVRDLAINGNKAAQSAVDIDGIYLTNCTDTSTRIIIKNVLAYDLRRSGIYVNNVKNTEIDRCIARTCVLSGFALTTGGSVTLSRCTAVQNYHGIYLNGATDCVVHACVTRNNEQQGIRVTAASAYNTINGCIVSYNGVEGIAILGVSGYNEITGCAVRYNGFDGISITDSSAYTIVAGCVITGNEANGIYIYGSGCLLNAVTGCTVVGNTHSGIYLNGATYGTVVGCCINFNGRDGLYLYNANRNVCQMNAFSGNSDQSWNSYSNIMLAGSSSWNSVIGNNTYKGGNNQARWGCRVDGASCTGNLVTANYFNNGGATGAFSDLGTNTDKTAWMDVSGGNHV